jgi:hypothetical protein
VDWDLKSKFVPVYQAAKGREPSDSELEAFARLLKECGYDFPTQIVPRAVFDEAEKMAK